MDDICIQQAKGKYPQAKICVCCYRQGGDRKHFGQSNNESTRRCVDQSLCLLATGRSSRGS